MHDGAPAYFYRPVLLNNNYRHRWIDRAGPVSRPPQSPNLNSLDFYLWGHFKSVVYDVQIDNKDFCCL